MGFRFGVKCNVAGDNVCWILNKVASVYVVMTQGGCLVFRSDAEDTSVGQIVNVIIPYIFYRGRMSQLCRLQANIPILMNDNISTCCSTLFRFLTFTPICVIDFMTTMRVFTMVYECLVDKWMWLKVKEMGNSNTEEGGRGTGDSKVKCSVISAKLLFSKQANVITNNTKRNCLLKEKRYRDRNCKLVTWSQWFFPFAILFPPTPWRPLAISSKPFQVTRDQELMTQGWDFKNNAEKLKI